MTRYCRSCRLRWPLDRFEGAGFKCSLCRAGVAMDRIRVAQMLVITRYELGLSQDGLAELTSFYARWVYEGEQGKSRLTIPAMQRCMADARAKFEALSPRERGRMRNQNRRFAARG